MRGPVRTEQTTHCIERHRDRPYQHVRHRQRADEVVGGLPDLPVHREADDDEEVAEGCDDDTDGHADGDEDGENHTEGRRPAGGAAVLHRHPLAGAAGGGVGAESHQAGVPGGRHAVRGRDGVGHRGEGRHRPGDQRAGRGCRGLQQGPADLLVATLGCRAQPETLRPLTVIFRGTEASELPGNREEWRSFHYSANKIYF